MRTLTDDEMDRFSHAIAADGAAAHEAVIAEIAQLAATAGAPRPVLEVLTDPTAPEVVRARAWGRAVAVVRGIRTNPEVALVA